MQQNNLVTVICTCYNHEKYAIKSIQSVINQTYKNIQLIVVDDFSQDNSVKIIANFLLNYPSIQFIKNNNNLGVTKSFNNAMQNAKGQFIIDLAADDVLMPNCIEKQVAKFINSQYKNLGLVYGNVENIDENDNFISNYFEINNQKNVIKPRVTGNAYLSVIQPGNSICSVSAIYSREIFDTLKGYDENLAYEDLDFWVRLSNQYEIDFIDEFLVQKRYVKNSLGNQFEGKTLKFQKKLNESTFKILKKIEILNSSKAENFALLKRIHFEIELNLKNRNFYLLLKYFLFKLKVHFKLFI